MFKRNQTMSRHLLTLFLLTLAPALSAATADKPFVVSAQDPMQRPALKSRLASRSVLVGVARAGDRLVAVGERGHVVISNDHARSWQQVEVPVSVTLTAVHFVDERAGWAVGHSGVILHSNDGGSTWRKQLDGVQANQLIAEAARASGNPSLLERAKRFEMDGPDKPFLAVHFIDTQRGLAVGAFGMAFATEDGGQQWRPILDLVPNDDERHIYAIHQVADALYLAGEQGLLLRRLAQQGNFEKLETPFRSTVFKLLNAADGTLLAAGLGGKVYRSTDQGRQWDAVTPAGKTALTAGIVTKDGVVLVNETGQLLLSADGGRNFKTVSPTGQPFPAAGLAAAANGQLVVVGPFGVQALPTPSFHTN